MDREFRSMKVTGLVNAKALFLQNTDDNLSTSSAREYFESVKGQLTDGDQIALNAIDGIKNFTVVIDRNGDITALNEIA